MSSIDLMKGSRVPFKETDVNLETEGGVSVLSSRSNFEIGSPQPSRMREHLEDIPMRDRADKCNRFFTAWCSRCCPPRDIKPLCSWVFGSLSFISLVVSSIAHLYSQRVLASNFIYVGAGCFFVGLLMCLITMPCCREDHQGLRSHSWMEKMGL